MNVRLVQAFKESQLRTLTDLTGVYALCDLDETPIYVGKSTDGIRTRVRRHLTSARSDVIANRQIDVWEIAFVWAWEMDDPELLGILEGHLMHKFNATSPLVNGDVTPNPGRLRFRLPDRVRVQVIPEEEIVIRRDPAMRFPRQIQHFNQLVDYVLNTQDKPHLRQAVSVYLERLNRYCQSFLDSGRSSRQR